MRIVHDSHIALGQIPIPEIEIDPGSHDDIPAVLKGIQHIYCDEPLRESVFDLLEEHLLQPVAAPTPPTSRRSS